VKTVLAPTVGRQRSDAPQTVLLVEDDTGLRLLITRVLERCGLTVLCAESGLAALKIWDASKEKIELLLTDIFMPGMTGCTLAEMLQAQRAELKILFMSGGSVASFHGAVRPVAGVNLIAKPFSAREIETAVRDCLERHD